MRFWIASVAAGTLGLAGAAAAPAQEGVDVPTRVDEAGQEVYHAGDVVGMVVHDADNQPVGRVEDLVIDAHTDEVLYAVVSFSEVREIGDQWVVLPAAFIQPRQDFVLLAAPMRTIVRAPAFAAAEFRQMRFTQWAPRVDRFFADVDVRGTRLEGRDGRFDGRQRDVDIRTRDRRLRQENGERIERRELPIREREAAPRTDDAETPRTAPRLDRRPRTSDDRAPRRTPGVRPTTPRTPQTAPQPQAPESAPRTPQAPQTAPQTAPQAPAPQSPAGGAADAPGNAAPEPSNE